MTFAPSRRATCQLLVAALVAAAWPSGGRAQIAGENVNMVTGTKWPGGDPYLQRQNEPSVAISTVNPDHLLAGANDYRTVDLPNPNSPDETGDAWLGVFKSFDGGQTWQSTLIPGYPADPARTAPLFGMGAGADPLVRAGPGGLFFYSGIVFNRGSNIGQVFVSRFIDVNNKENGSATAAVPTDPIQYVGTAVVDSGTAGQFEDKPWIAVDVPRGTKTCSVPTTVNGAAASVTIPAFNVYFAYAVFTGSSASPSSKVMFTASSDCGQTWGKPQKLSESNAVNQGTNMAIDPVTGAIYVAWRRFAAGSQGDAILMAKSTNGGATFTKAFAVAPTLLPFDQNMSGSMFRTEALPSVAVSASGSSSWVHVAWSQRPAPGADAQVVLATSADGVTWPAPVPVDAAPVADDYGHAFTRGHQFMPALSFSQGRLVVVYYDSRLDHTRGYLRPNNPFVPDVVKAKFYTEDRGPIGELAYNPGAVWTPTLDDAGLVDIRHTIDVRVAYAVASQSTGFAAPSFSSTQVSQYPIGVGGSYSAGQTVPSFGTAAEVAALLTDPVSGLPFTPPYLTPDLKRLYLTDLPAVQGTPPDLLLLEQLSVNPPNLPMFAQGTVPFIGDYIDVAGVAFVPKATAPYWAFAVAPAGAPVFHAVWTSNQDVVVPIDPATGLVNWKLYTPPGSGGTSTFDPTQTRPVCVPGNEGSRNQNIYTARISEGLRVSSPQNVKPLNTPRAFVVAVQNTTSGARSVRWTVGAKAATIQSASFSNQGALQTTVYATIPPHATAFRTLFVTGSSADPFASITVNVAEVALNGACVAAVTCADVPGGLGGFVTMNPPAPPGAYLSLVQPDAAPGNVSSTELYLASVTNASVTNANVTNASITNASVTNASVTNASVTNASVTNASVTNAAVWNASVTNASVTNASVTNASVTNANVTNASVTNSSLSASVTNASVTNASVTNANVTNASISDATYLLTNTGNTAHTYHVKIVGAAPTGSGPLQLILTKTYSTPSSAACVPAEQGHTILVNSIDDISPAIVGLDSFLTQPFDPDIPDPSTTNATLALAPGETGQVTLRGALGTAAMANLAAQLVPVAIPHAGGSFSSPLFIGLPATQSTLAVGIPYTVQLVYGGNTSTAYSLLLLSGALPGGLTLTTNGLSGTPLQAGTFTFTLQATDASGATVTRTLSLTVTKAPSSTSLVPAPVTPVYGQPVTLTATAAGVSSGPAATGTMTFYDLGATCPLTTPSPLPAPLGSAATGVPLQLTGGLPVGAHCVLATYSGDGSYLASTAQATVTVGKGATATTVAASPATAVYGQAVTLSATTVAVAPAVGTPTGAPVFYDLGATCPATPPATAPASGAISSPISSLAVGTHCIAAYAPGDANFSGSAGTTTLTVGKGNTAVAFGAMPSTIVFGQVLALSASVSAVAPAAGAPTGTVSFYDVGASCPTALPASLPAPLASAAVGAPVTAPALLVGSHCLLALYGGDGNFNDSRAGGGFAASTITVTPAATATTVTSAGSPGPIAVAFGQSVPLTISVSIVAPGSGTPSGSIAVTDPVGNVLALVQPYAGGAASVVVSTSGLVPGTNVLTAAYTPSTPAQTSASAATITLNLSQASVSVTVATTTTTGAALASSVFGQPVQLTATVQSSNGAPSGLVTLYDGATALGSFPVGAATVALGSLSVGSHAFSAIYGGDVDFSSAASASLAFTVNKAATTTSVSASPNPVAWGQPVTIAATVAALAPSLATLDGAVSFYDLGATCPSPLPALPAASARLGSAAVGTPLTTSSLTAGTHCLAAYYTSSSGNFLASSAATPLSVAGYTFTGFFSPLSAAQLLTSPTYSSYSGAQNFGSAVPLKWQLATSGGTAVTSTTSLAAVRAYANTSAGCKGPPAPGAATTGIYSPGSGFTGNSSFKFDPTSGLFQFNWDTSVMAGKGCYTIALQLADGATWATNVKLQ